MKTKRENKNKKPRYQQEEQTNEFNEDGGFGKNLILLVEGL